MTQNPVKMLGSRRPTTAPPDTSLDAGSVLTLSDSERATVGAAADKLAAAFAYPQLDLLTEASVQARELPPRVLELLCRFQRYSNADGAVVVRNLPLDDPLPPTPCGADPIPEVPLSSAVQLLLASLLGAPIGYEDEQDGRLIHNVRPLPGDEERQQNSGSVLFELHSENAFHPYRPDFVTLLCLRADHDSVAKTTIAPIGRALELLPTPAVEMLRRDGFWSRLAPSFGDNGGRPLTGPPTPVLAGDARWPHLTVDFFATEAADDAGRWALGRLGDALRRVQRAVPSAPGTFTAVDNRAAVHGRTSFQPRYDGHDRWLRRIYVTVDIRPSQAWRPATTHICAPFAYSAHT